jgi:peptide-methionine (S)-S-oxide reductase
MEGVNSVESGYMGGHVVHPTYEQVCTGRTGHAEVVQLNFDPDVTSFREILEVFFTIHDPTTPDRQGNDVGPQYRSVIFYHSDEQKRVAQEVISDFGINGIWGRPIVTQLQPASEFYVAEDYHQEYFDNNPRQSYCMFVVSPKVQKFREKFKNKLKTA